MFDNSKTVYYNVSYSYAKPQVLHTTDFGWLQNYYLNMSRFLDLVKDHETWASCMESLLMSHLPFIFIYSDCTRYNFYSKFLVG